MNLYLLRHGIAAPRGASGFALDSKRPLTPEGEKKLRRVAKGMAELELAFDVILSSPFVRAQQTAAMVAKKFGAQDRLRLTRHLTPAGKPRALIDQINGLPPPADHVLLVGHEPYLSELISVLVTGQTGACFAMKKAGLCKLTAEALQYARCATLEWLLTPGQLSLMG
jgi:phosphohistidine phosphatase